VFVNTFKVLMRFVINSSSDGEQLRGEVIV